MNAGIRFNVRLTPKGGRNVIEGWNEANGRPCLKARVSAPASDGKANEALLRLIAGELGVGVTRVRIVSGATSRTKTIEVDGIPALPVGFGTKR